MYWTHYGWIGQNRLIYGVASNKYMCKPIQGTIAAIVCGELDNSTNVAESGSTVVGEEPHKLFLDEWRQ